MQACSSLNFTLHIHLIILISNHCNTSFLFFFYQINDHLYKVVHYGISLSLQQQGNIFSSEKGRCDLNLKKA